MVDGSRERSRGGNGNGVGDTRRSSTQLQAKPGASGDGAIAGIEGDPIGDIVGINKRSFEPDIKDVVVVPDGIVRGSGRRNLTKSDVVAGRRSARGIVQAHAVRVPCLVPRR